MSSTVADVSDFDDNEGGLSGFTILAIAATLLMVFALVVYYAYRQGVASAIAANEELPVVAADPSPIADDIPLDATRESARQEVYDRVSGALPTEVVTAENPARGTLDGYGGAPASMTPREVAAADEAAAVASASTNNAAVTAEPEVRTINPPSRNPRTAAAAQTQPVRQEPLRVTEATPRPTATNTASTAGAVAAGTHVVQVGAFPSNDSALDYFDGLSSRMGTMLSGKLPDIQVAEVNGRTYHRLRIGPFMSKAEADRYCADLKTRGQDCLVRGV